MKKLFHYKFFTYLILISTLWLSGCESNNPCNDVVCINGDCINGQCDCYPGYSGPSCANENRPIKITLDRIELIDFPQTNPQGGGWDTDGTGPDVYLTVYSGDTKVWEAPSYVSNAINTNNYTFTPATPITMNSTKSMSIFVYDYENFTSDTEMGGVITTGEIWNSFLKGNGFPSETNFYAGEYSFKLFWTFSH
jgi:hypothetical protein